MADLAALAAKWAKYQGQIISGSVTCPVTDRVERYSLKLVNVLWNGISDRISFRFNDGQGSDHELLFTEAELQMTPKTLLAQVKQRFAAMVLAELEAREFDDIGGVEF